MRGIRNAVRIATMLVLVLPVTGFAQSTQQPAAPPPVAVVPGLGVGDWTIDRKFADYVFQLGVPNTATNGVDLSFRSQLEETSWAAPSVVVVYPPASNVVWALGTNDAGAKTVERVGVGSTEEQVVAAYGAPPLTLELPLRSKTLIYDDRGVAFELGFMPAAGKYGATARVFVFRPGQGRAIWRLP
jgi:hypothetical protein